MSDRMNAAQDHAFTSSRARLALLLRRRVGSKREDKDFDRMVRHKTVQIVVFSFMGVAMMVIELLTSWAYFSDTHEAVDAYYDDPAVSVRLANALTLGQAFISTSTFVAIVLITQKYQVELIRKRAEWSGTNIFEVEGFRGVAVRDTTQRDYFLSSFNFWRSRLAVSCGAEILVHLIHPIMCLASVSSVPDDPANYEYTPINITYKLFQLAMFLRLYLVRDLVREFHPAYLHRFEIVTHDPDLLSVGYDIDTLLTVKMTIHSHPIFWFVFASVLLILVFGVAVFNFERVEGPIDPDTVRVVSLRPEDAFWFAFDSSRNIGATTQPIPRTVIGRFLTAFCIIGGISLGALYSGVLVSQIPPSKELKQAMEYIHTTQADNQLRVAAAELIQTAWRRKSLRLRQNTLDGSAAVRRHGAVKIGDIIIDAAAAAEQAVQDEYLHRFGLDPGSQGHKGDRLYYAVKHFQTTRKNLQGSFTQAKDVVVNQKMDAIMALSHALKRELLEHQHDFEATEKEILDQFTSINELVLYYRKLGHVAI
ncbi:membrane-associated protein, putative [Bodo saltans]|uniref:Membrane-associated protein, putative n=1 Tax=Bodo saltans TaxID=75058 RepID=A0A0S4JQN2_BODSA|nr:membrane-associated protein, putative [Bodo saltans]|eukprot:CUG91351.1 membrane-associated protein, putative [Bodo saltans]